MRLGHRSGPTKIWKPRTSPSIDDLNALRFYRDHLGIERTIHPRAHPSTTRILGAGLRGQAKRALYSAGELERLVVREVLVGDIIYDAYCTHHGVPTPDFGSSKLRSFLAEAIQIVYFWDRFFRKNSVSAIVGETVYLQGIPLRLAQKYGVPVFVANQKGLERIDCLNPWEDSLYRHYPELAKALPPKEVADGIEEANRSLKRLLGGEEIDRLNLYSGPSAFAQLQTIPEWPDDGRDSVLIVPHDFFDSSHVKGPHLYPDFYLWLWRLGELSRSVNLNWWLKPHPRESDRTMRIYDEFLSQFPHIRSLPGKINPRDFKTLRVRAAMTVRGTIAGEYPLIGVPVVNASTSNMHSRYRFSITPPTVEEYEELVLTLDQIQHRPESEGLSEFFYLRHIFEYRGTFLSPAELVERSWESDTDVVTMWNELSAERRNLAVERVKRFLGSGAHWLRGSVLAGLDRNGKIWIEKEA